MNNLGFKIVGAIAGLIAFAAVRGFGTVDVDKELEKAAAQINQRGPVTVDSDTRMDRVTTGHLSLVYNYTLVKVAAKDIPDVTEFQRSVRTYIIDRARSSSDMKIFFKHGVTVSYRYSDKNGSLVAQVDITPKDVGY